MLFSEEKERQKRFILSLEIALPFVFVLILFGIFLYNNQDLEIEDIMLLVILFLCYVYYTIYLIYFSFKKSIIDPVTKVFNLDELKRVLRDLISDKEVNNVSLIRIENIKDINERYGFDRANKVLRNFILKFENFMYKNGFSKIPIGMVNNGDFVFITKGKISQLEHILRTFERKILNEGVDNIEIKTDFAIILDNTNSDPNNLLNTLFFKIAHKDEENVKVIKTDNVKELILYAIENELFEIKYQTIKSLKDNKDFYSLNFKLYTDEIGGIPKSKIIDIIIKNGYEIQYDLSIIKAIAKEIDFKKLDSKIFIEISPISLRNIDFRNFVFSMNDKGDIDAKKIVFEFNEDTIYPEISRFDEILLSFKKIGFEFCINKFGGKNASFEYLKYLPISYAIYDMEFNKNLKQKRIKRIFDHLNEICAEFNIKTIIRFIDKKDFFEELKKTKIDYIQGFCIDKLKSVKEFKK